MAKKHALFRSVWDGDIEVETSCVVNMKTGRIIEIEEADVDDLDLEVLEYQEIQLSDGRCFEVSEDDDGYYIVIA